jgi:hypothetical protein
MAHHQTSRDCSNVQTNSHQHKKNRQNQTGWDGISSGIGGGIDALEARTGIEPMYTVLQTAA